MAERHGCGNARTRLLLIRHAPSTWNGESRWQGWADPPLADEWVYAVDKAAASIPACISAVASSDLMRARDTAGRLADALGVGPVQVAAGLREQHAGLWTGLTKSEIKRRWPQQLRARPRQPVDGESAQQVLRRATSALAAIAAQRRAGGCVLVVTHSAVIRTLELDHGVAAPVVGHLQGRWFGIMPDAQLRPGELTAARRTTEVGPS